MGNDAQQRPTVCICTVGTGTAGRHSNLAQGIVHAMLQRGPDRCCLTPSRHSESETLADLVTEALEARGLPCCRCGAFPDPDDLLGCRSKMRRIIRELRNRLGRAAAGQWPRFPALVQQFRFPDIHPLIKEELDHV